MDYVEAEGSSIDEAIERALAELGVTRDKAEIEIVADATRGLFGLGGRKARVRATRRSPVAERVAEPAPRAHESTPAPVTRRSPAGDGADREAAGGAGAPPLDGESLERARAVLEEITRRMGIEASAEALLETDGPRLALSGDTSGILIGRRGQTLDALEYLVNRIVARSDEHHGRIAVDSEDYRSRRRQSLEELARRTARQVSERGKPVTLNPLSPRDRRIVHLALQEEPGVVTRSSGEGFFRRLAILPASGGRRGPSERRRG